MPARGERTPRSLPPLHECLCLHKTPQAEATTSLTQGTAKTENLVLKTCERSAAPLPITASA